MRTRINSICICDNGIITFTQPIKIQEQQKRRAKFEQDWKKKERIILVKKTPELISFSNGVENAIKQFRNNIGIHTKTI